MTLNLCVLTPNRIVWDLEVKEIILSTNSGQIGVLPNFFLYRKISQGRVINTWADIINCANLGMEVMHERNAHNFPLDLATFEAPSTNR